MSQDTHQPEQTTGGSGRNNNSSWIYLGVIAVLVCVSIYLYFSRNNAIQTNQRVIVQYDSVRTDRNEIKAEYDQALGRLDDLISKNTTLNNEINNKNGEIARIRKQLQDIMSKRTASNEDIQKARQLIAELNNRVRGYEDRIAQLEGENRNLTTANTTLAQERDSTASENRTMKKLGSVLHASNIRLSAINLRRRGAKEEQTSKAGKADMLRIVFDIDENRIAEDGPKELYFCIFGPSGELLSNAAYGSGITSRANGGTLNYTLHKEISLVKAEPLNNISIDWRQESDYARGNYVIEIYNEGYKIGSGNVTLR